MVVKKTNILAVLWSMVIILLPITTPPFLPLGNTVVKPVSILPATLILLVVFFFSRKKFRFFLLKENLLLYVFLIYCFFVGFIAISGSHLNEYKGLTSNSAFFRAYFSLIMGVIFYISSRLILTNKNILLKSEVWIMYALSASVFLALMQYLEETLRFKFLSPIIDFIVNNFVETAIYWTGRYHGFAYEPSWLAGQIVLLMLPFVISRILCKKNMRKIKILGILIPLEYCFAAISLLGIIVAGSRTGLFALASIVLVGVFTTLGKQIKIRTLKILLASIILSVSILPLILSNNYIRSTFSGMQNFSSLPQFANQVHALPRFSAWVAGINLFKDNPLIGVGLGNSTLFFPNYVPNWGLVAGEVQDWLSEDNPSKPNPKNMIIRLLSETGIIGAFLFVFFIYLHFRIIKSDDMYIKVLKMTSLVALAINYLSVDTFALPNEWFLMAFVFLTSKFNIHEHKGNNPINVKS